MRIHLVYAGDPNMGAISSPFSITHNLYYYLKERAEVLYYEWSSASRISTCKNDVVIGHPHYDPNTVLQHFYASNQECRVKCTIHPFHSLRVEDNFPFDHLTRASDAIFSICGPYWYDTIDKTLFAHWKEKMVRLDMAVSGHHFPFMRKKFNPVGKRRLLYIGSSTPHKNLGFMVQIMQKLPTVILHWYGGDGSHPLAKLPNVKTVGWTLLDTNAAMRIVDQTDIFINTSISDANPTTLLETTAWGMIGACTPQSGYYDDPMFDALDLSDLDASVHTIKQLLHAPEDILIERAINSRKMIETKYNWEVFCKKVYDKLKDLYDRKG